MRKIIRIFAWALAVVVVLFAGLLFWLRNADLSAYQDEVETFVSNRIGHQLTIDGRFELQFGRTTRVIAENVALSNPDWESGPELVSVAHLSVEFDTWSVFGRPFVIESLEANDISGHLAQNDAGQVNWAADLPARDSAEPGEFDPNRIAFREVNIQNIEWVYESPTRPRPVNAVLDHLTVSPDANDILDLDLAGTVNDLPLWADGKLGPWQNFVDGQDIFADLDVSLGQVNLAIDGTVADTLRLEGVTAEAVLSGPDIARVTERLAVPPFAAGEFEVTASLQQMDNGHQLRIDGNIGDIELFVSGNFDSLLRPTSVAHDFNVSGPDASRIAALFGITDALAAPFRISGDYARDGREIRLGDTIVRVGPNAIALEGELELVGRVPDWDFNVDAAGPDFSVIGPFLQTEGLPEEAFTAVGRVRKEGTQWQSENLLVVVGDNQLTIDGQLETGTSGTTEIAVHGSGPDISFVESFTDLEGVPARPYDISATIRPDPKGIEVEDAIGVFGENRFEVDGIVALVSQLQGTELTATASGPDLHNIAALAEVPYLPPGPFQADGKVQFDGDQLMIEDARITVAELQGSASGGIAIFGDSVGDFDLAVTVAGPDLGVVPEIEAIDQLTGEPFSVDGGLAYDGEQVTATGMEIALGGLEATVDGYVVGPATLAGLSITARSEDSLILRKLAKLEYLPEGAVGISGTIEKTETEIQFTDTTVKVGEFLATANGALNLSPRRNDSDLVFSVSGPNLHEVAMVAGNTMFPEKGFSVAGQFNGTPSGFELREFKATLGDTDIAGEFDADLTGKPKIVGVLASQYFDMTNPAPLPDEGIEEESEEQEEEAKGNRIFSAEPLDTSWLQKADIDIDLTIDHLTANTLDVHDVRIALDLLDGALSISPFELREQEGSLRAQFELVPSDVGYAMRTLLDAESMHIGLLFAENEPISTLPTLSGNLRLTGQGNSVRELMASANGAISFRQSSGKVKEVFGSAFFKDVLLQVLRTLNPMRKSRDYQILECGIYNATITNGLMTIDEFIIQTDTMTTVASGEVNLQNEKLEIGFRAKPREGIGISLGTVANQMLEVRGTLKEPRVRLDAGRTATTTGAAVATGGLTLLARGLWDRLSAEADVCKQDD